MLADGGANASRSPGITFREKDYGQHAVVAKVGTDRAHRGVAYERFTPEGPVALLPAGERYALIYTTSPRGAERLLALDDARIPRRAPGAFRRSRRALHFDCVTGVIPDQAARDQHSRGAAHRDRR